MNKYKKDLFAIALALALCVVFLGVVMRLWRFDADVPIFYGQGFAGFDYFVHSAFIKGVIENGFSLHNPRLGMPLGLDWQDFPFYDLFHLLIFRVFSYFTSDPTKIYDLYVLATFPLVELFSYLVFRVLRISRISAVVCSILFAFLPYHFFHGFKHIFITPYFFIPLYCLLLIWIWRNELQAPSKMTWGDKTMRSKILWGAGISLLLGIANASLYNAFFCLFFLVVIAVVKFLKDRNFGAGKTCLFFGGLTCFAVFLNVSPSLLFIAENGRNPEVPARHFSEVEQDGLKLSQLLFPLTGHRLGILAKAKDRYIDFTGGMSDTDSATLGIFGSIGFLFLLAWALSGGWQRGNADLISGLSTLNLSAVLLATIGGFGVLINFFILPTFRSQYRICLFIAFFSLLALAILLDNLSRRWSRYRFGKIAFQLLAAIIICFGVWEQSSDSVAFVPPVAQLKTEFNQDRKFFSQIERSEQPGAWIYQVPYHSFPENAAQFNLEDYDHLRGYLHTSTLKWSYAAMRGRAADHWQKKMNELPLQELLESLVFAGFRGIYVDRFGYEDRGKQFEAGLSSRLGAPIVSDNGRMAYYSLRSWEMGLKQLSTMEEFSKKENKAKLDVIYGPQVRWGEGFSWMEGKPGHSWHWAVRPEAELVLSNPAPYPRKFLLNLTLSAPQAFPSKLQIGGPLLQKDVIVSTNRSEVSQVLNLPPGISKIRFSSEAEKFTVPPDRRVFFFMVENLQLKSFDESND